MHGDVRSTNSARRVKALIEQVTGTSALHFLKLFIHAVCPDRYQSLPRLPQRVRFLLHVQMPILDQYCARISASLDAFETLSSTLARAVPGGLTGQVDMGARRLTSGVEGASRLVKALISARAVEGAILGWGEDVVRLVLRRALSPDGRCRAVLPRAVGGDEPSACAACASGDSRAPACAVCGGSGPGRYRV